MLTWRCQDFSWVLEHEAELTWEMLRCMAHKAEMTWDIAEYNNVVGQNEPTNAMPGAAKEKRESRTGRNYVKWKLDANKNWELDTNEDDNQAEQGAGHAVDAPPVGPIDADAVDTPTHQSTGI